MPANSRRIETITIVALIVLIALVVRGWEPVRKAHLLTHNTLGRTDIHVPTADLFLWTAFALIFYFGTRIWAILAPHVFELSPESASAWRSRLQIVRLLSTFILLGLCIHTISSAVPDFTGKILWP
ncbi:MAG: hypothetical protein ACKV2U_09400 [Bryobacteraceae bacterium]